MKKNDSYKKTRVFPDQRPSELERQHRGLLTLKKAKKSAARFSRYGTFSDSGMPGQRPGPTVDGTKMNFFFDQLQMIQFAKLTGFNRYLSTFQKFPLLQGLLRPSLRNFSRRNENTTIKNSTGQVCYTVIQWWTVDISDVIIIEVGQLSVEGFAVFYFFYFFIFSVIQPSSPYICAKMKCWDGLCFSTEVWLTQRHTHRHMHA